MSNDQSDSNTSIARYSGTGLIIGGMIGLVFGVFLNDWGMGFLIGMGIGLVLGPAVGLAIGKSTARLIRKGHLRNEKPLDVSGLCYFRSCVFLTTYLSG